MIMNVRGINVNVKIWNESEQEVIVLLHGFTGTVSTWQPVVPHLPNDKKLIAIDLIGHGNTDAPSDVSRYSMEEQIKDLEEIFKILHLESFMLIGYSMGGRVALSYACCYPNRVNQLILESTSPGLKTVQERLNRKSSDHELANKIEQNGLLAFVNDWENIPLFESQRKLTKEVQLAVRNERLSQREIGLANSLRGMGTGSQKELWSQLHQINIPVYLITGELDEKFCQIAQQMMAQLSNAHNIIVKDVGHAIHVENPTQFATIVKNINFKK
nr:2-succinyl-6-hydroxy-2,4-cyclohexadiene-1-carboxylate synthase [Lysinibacillus timonensis]